MSNNRTQIVVTIFLLFLSKVSAKSDTVTELYKIVLMIKECLSHDKYPAVCLKERALEALNQTVYIDEPINFGFVRVEKNPEYDWNSSKSDTLPTEIAQRSLVLNDALYDKLEEFFRSRTIKLNVDDAVEGELNVTCSGQEEEKFLFRTQKRWWRWRRRKRWWQRSDDDDGSCCCLCRSRNDDWKSKHLNSLLIPLNNITITDGNDGYDSLDDVQDINATLRHFVAKKIQRRWRRG